MGLVVAVLLGLRHATDPDHLTALSTLVLGNPLDGPRRATRLGLAWGTGHALTLFAFGLPVVLFQSYLSETMQRAAEAAIGLVIVALAVRLLARWRRGYFHLHPHSHGELLHSHPHMHEHPHDPASGLHHRHGHAESLGRSPLAAFGIGLVHGIGGSAGIGVLLVGAVSGRTEGVLALVLFAAATAVAMAVVSTGFGYALASGRVQRRLRDLVPWFGAISLLFGIWYSLGAVQAGL
jgi:ABC-type nickel/cobalt efflux system permease component RcnA